MCKLLCCLKDSISFVAIEDEYDGPKLEDGRVSIKFTQELMEAYKAQKKLHRKYAYKVDACF